MKQHATQHVTGTEPQHNATAQDTHAPEARVSLPAPLVPAEVNLRGMPWMPLNVQRLLDSDLFALSSGDEFKAALTLWCKSWNQQPAASLPADDRILAAFCGKTFGKWKKIRAMVLRGWITCADGKLYHPVMAEQAMTAWKERLDYIGKRDADLVRKQREREERRHLFEVLRAAGQTPPGNTRTHALREMVSNVTDTSRVTGGESHSDVTASSRLRQGQGQGQGQGPKQEQDQKQSPSSSSTSQGATASATAAARNDDDGQAVPGEQDLPAWIPIPLWRQFYRHRAVARKPLSIPSQLLVVQRLTELRAQHHDIAESLRQTIGAGLAIPVIPKDLDHADRSPGRKLSAVEQVHQAIAAREAGDGIIIEGEVAPAGSRSAVGANG